jgi:DNA repair ATPase RecN
LKDEERIREVAKLLSGEVITETNLQTAKELMGIQK